MDADKVAYVFYKQNTINKASENRLIIYYSRETMDPVLAVRLTPVMRPPEGFKMIDYVIVTKDWFNAKCKELESMGLLLPYGKTISRVPRSTS